MTQIINGTVTGTAGDDTINLTDYLTSPANLGTAMRSDGGGGNDRIDGTSLNDIMNGGDGNDILNGGNGNNNIEGGAGDDTITVTGGANWLYGGDGHDTISGSSGADRLYGDAGNDRLTGGGGVDILDGGAGNDTFVLTGDTVDPAFSIPGGGTSYYRSTHASLAETYSGGDGIDTLEAGTANLTLVLNSAADLAADGVEAIAGGPLSGFRVAVQDNGPQDFTKIRLDHVVLDFGAGDDTVTGSSANQLVDTNGDGIADTSNGATGNDTIEGGAGVDTVRFNADYLAGRYSITLTENGKFRVEDTYVTDGNTGIDVLSGVERLEFNNRTFDFRPSPLQDGDTAGGEGGLVSENVTNGAGVGLDVNAVIGADLAEIAPGLAPIYRLTNDAGGRFQIDATTGVVTIKNANLIDFESTPLLGAGPDRGYTVTVEADIGGFKTQKVFSIAIADGNDSPDGIVDGDPASYDYVLEGAATGTYTGLTVQASDPNPGDSFTYSLVNDAGGRFQINPVTGVVTVLNGALIDYETAYQYAITVRATDAGGLYKDQVFFLHTQDKADDTLVDADPATWEAIIEGAPAGTYTGVTARAVSASGGTMTYALVDNAGGRFQINATTGVITVLDGRLLDFETSNSHSVTVRATDSAGIVTSQQFHIYLNDFVDDTIVDHDVANFEMVSEQAVTGAYTGVTARAVSAWGGTMTYSLIDNAGGRFQINATTGVVTVLNGALLDYEAQTAWTITVRASDGFSISDQNFYIYINDNANEGWVGTSGNDSFTVTNMGDQLLDGRGGNDTLTAIDGANVTFIGGTGNDILNGRNGNDVFLYTGTGGGMDAVSGGAGHDLVQATAADTIIGLSSMSGIEEISGGSFANVTLKLGSGNDVIDGIETVLSGIATIRAGAGGDFIVGTAGNESIFGEDGNDFIRGGGGADILSGGNGVDTISYEGSAESVNVNLSTNTASGGDATGDTISGFENIIATDFNDTIAGSALANVITGGAGDDVMNGWSGNDVFRIGRGSGVDSITGGIGTDTILITEDDAVLGLSALSTVEIIDATGINNATIAGNANSNVLNFSAVTMTNIAGIYGLGGNDTITGSAGADVLIGGAGNDILKGGGGDDIFRYLGGDEGYDALTGGTGTDLVEIAAGATLGLSSITEIEMITGAGDAVIQGSTGSNTLNFSAITLSGVALIDGGAGNDTITGSAGADTIRGGSGADVLAGGLGSDDLRGGTGNDVFDFNAVSESGLGALSDIIQDFVKGQDKLDVATIDADLAFADDQSFTFIGSGAFTNVAGQLRFSTPGDGFTHVFGDVNGDGVADFEIRLTGTYSLAATDFIL